MPERSAKPRPRWPCRLLVVACALCLAGCHTWLVRETDHLRIHYRANSFAARNLEQACAQYEASYQSLEDAIPGYKPRKRFRIFLHEEMRVAGRTNRLTGALHYLYSEKFTLTSAHEMMHLALDEVNSSAPGRLEEGVCRNFESRTLTVGERTESAGMPRFARLEPEDSWRIDAVFRRGYDTPSEGNIASAFVAFLLDYSGEERFWAFYRRVTMRNYKALLEEHFGQSLAEVERLFRSFVRALEPPPRELREMR